MFQIDDINAINEVLRETKSLSKVPAEVKKFSDREVKRKALELGFKYSAEQKQFIKNEVPNLSHEEVVKRLLEVERKIAKMGKAPSTSKDIEINSKYTNDIKTRSFMVSESALAKFDKLAKGKLAQYRKQDLFTLALLEFVENHK